MKTLDTNKLQKSQETGSSVQEFPEEKADRLIASYPSIAQFDWSRPLREFFDLTHAFTADFYALPGVSDPRLKARLDKAMLKNYEEFKNKALALARGAGILFTESRPGEQFVHDLSEAIGENYRIAEGNRTLQELFNGVAEKWK